MNNTTHLATRNRSFKVYLWWATTVAWAATIFKLSTGAYAGWFTAWLLQQTLDLFHITASPPTFQLLHNLIRKLAHLTEYAIYALLLYGSLSGGRDFGWRARRAIGCVAVAGAYSLTDELHQWFVPTRGASLLDSAIDTLGALLAIVAVYAVNQLHQARARKTAAKKESPAEA